MALRSNSRRSVRVELFGVARHRAGVAAIDVEAATLGEALQAAGRKLPLLNGVCLDGERLRPGFLANVNGRMFVSDSNVRLADGDSVLIVSSDAGG